MARGREKEREAPKGVEYEGPSGIARESTWLTHEDLVEGRDVAAKIEAVLRYPKLEFEGGRGKQNAIGLKFVGKERVLLLNATNRKVMNAMFGNLTRLWKGQEVTMFVTETEAFGDTVKCVRIRKRGARAATAAEQFLHDEKEEQRGEPKAAQPGVVANGADLDDPAERERLLREDDGGGDRGTDAELPSS